jgi:hypothetical protein
VSNAGRDALLVTRFIKLESFSSVWPQLCSEMGVPATELQVRNATPNRWRRSVGELFTKADDLQLINTIHADDFRWFNYETVGRNLVPRVIAGPDPSVKT